MRLYENLPYHPIYARTVPGKIKTYIFAVIHKT